MKGPRTHVSRRTILQQCLSALVLAASGTIATCAVAASKVTKASAGYRGHPNNGERCGKCVHYKFPLTCERVQGPVSAFGWCNLFEPK